MRIAVDAAAAWTGGGGSRVRELVNAFPLLAPQHDYLFILGRQAADQVREHDGIGILEVPRLLRTPPTRTLWEQIVLPRKLNRAGIAWVLAPFNVLPLGPGLASETKRAVVISSILPLVPSMWRDLHGYQSARVRALRSLTLRSLDVADRVFFLSREAHRLLSSHVPEDKLRYLPMAPPNPRLLERASKTKVPDRFADRPYFVVAADLLPYKGIEDAILATGSLVKHQPNTTLLICGNPVHSGYSRKLHSMTMEARANVHFLGGLPQPTVLALMRNSMATIACSPFENPGRIPIEAMAASSPVISVDTPTAHETLGEAALYYEPGNHAGLARAMHRMMVSADLRRTLIQKADQQLAGKDWLTAARIILDSMGAL